jgi:hypothetical protein
MRTFARTTRTEENNEKNSGIIPAIEVQVRGVGVVRGFIGTRGSSLGGTGKRKALPVFLYAKMAPARTARSVTSSKVLLIHLHR